MPASETGIDFVERLDWNHPRGLLFYTGYACGGIAVGDLDGNGLPDLFFPGGAGECRLYFQNSPWKFEERTAESGLQTNANMWSTGATVLDIDNDCDLDLYVCNYDEPNQLYLNRGDGTFVERAAEYGLDVVDACLMASVADYDRDGDLDLYLVMNRYLDEIKFQRRDLFYWRDGSEYLRPEAEKYFAIRRYRHRPGQLNMWAGRTDRLLRNEGPGKKFADASAAMGLERGDTLSATWCDYDHDGWPDLYVANDMAAPDRLFHNLGDGRFVDVALTSLPHTPWFAMGSSTGDINNDGLLDLLVADMSFRTHFKDKATMGDMSSKFRNVSVFPHDQLMRNALFVNSGTENFQEAAYLAGLASTDWTWTAKLADLDNDGRLDAFFTNGTPVNLATVNATAEPAPHADGIDTGRLRKRYGSLPPVLEQNLVFQNQGDLKFKDRSESWGLAEVGMSFAAVHADLDRDGDLDLVVANLNTTPSMYRNDSTDAGVRIELRGRMSNRQGVGAEVRLQTVDGQQVRQSYPVAGFQSCQEPALHFGLGATQRIKRLTVRWPSGAEQLFKDLEAGQQLRIEEPATSKVSVSPETNRRSGLFEPVAEAIHAEHHEQPFDDFARQPLLPHKLSQLGPAMAWGDVDHDGDLDLFVGDGAGWMGMLYLNEGGMRFQPVPQVEFANDEACEDSAALFFDANGDGHLDLYVGSGSVEAEPGDVVYRDRLYFGDGRGGFKRAADNWLPDLRWSTGALASSDFDHDGYLDLFVGSRSIPGEYPRAPQHALLRNDGEMFVNALDLVAEDLSAAGMVTDAVWADIDGDGWQDLLVTTDWGPIRWFRNQQGRLVEATRDSQLDQWSGWWQSLAAADVDNDGDIDLVAGNFGLNTKYHAERDKPVLIYYGEYDDSGQKKLIEAGYEDGVLFPLRGKSCSSAAMPHLAKQFPTYELFAQASLPEIYTPECLERAERFEANTLESACFLNDGHGRFSMQPLPNEAQLAPIFDLAIADLDEDGKQDLLLGQNFFSPQRETGPMDGGLSLIALGRGDGSFRALRADEAGIVVPEDTKAVNAIDIDGDGRLELCLAANDGPVRLFRVADGRPVQSAAKEFTSNAFWCQQNLELAEQLFTAKQFEQSLPSLRRVLKVQPEHLQANLMMAQVLRQQERFLEASEVLARLQDSANASETAVVVEQARLHLAMEHYDLAAAVLLAAAKHRPDDQQLQETLGELRVAQGLPSLASEHFRRAGNSSLVRDAEFQIATARIAFEQAQAEQAAGNTADAIHLYEKSRRRDARPATLRALAKLLQSTEDDRLRDPWYAEQLLRWNEQLQNPKPDASE